MILVNNTIDMEEEFIYKSTLVLVFFIIRDIHLFDFKHVAHARIEKVLLERVQLWQLLFLVIVDERIQIPL